MVVIPEHSAVDLDLTRRQAEALQKTGYVTVSPLAGDRWRVATSSFVGSLAADDIELLIRPKTNPENLFLLLEPGLPPHAWRRELFDYGATSDLLPSVIAFFSRTVETALGRGIVRAYEARDDELIALRGRMDVTGQFRRGGVLSPLACTFDEYSQDTPENRALKAAIRIALRMPRLRPEIRRLLMHQLTALEESRDVVVGAGDIDAIQLTRLNRHYEPALRLARLILANLSLADVHGTTRAQSFMVDMNDLFQRFITERLSRALRGKATVRSEPTHHLGVHRQISMQPDLVFASPDGTPRFVADVKYKIASDARARSQDYYQLLAYVTSLDLPEGMLIYCSSDAGGSRRTVPVHNTDKRLTVRALDLTGSPDDVDRQIHLLADDIVVAMTRIPARA
ncbi:McrC family protein [Corynebacterium sp. NPDC060344]|uniref:McrC family protein n=1 Tax=Corynebacterium sp. NPDC060344 TaxID=3347101 RepID=UPI00366978A5